MAEREGLNGRIVPRGRADLSIFEDKSFDSIFHPVANVFTPELNPVWQECVRGLRLGGALVGRIHEARVFLV